MDSVGLTDFLTEFPGSIRIAGLAKNVVNSAKHTRDLGRKGDVKDVSLSEIEGPTQLGVSMHQRLHYGRLQDRIDLVLISTRFRNAFGRIIYVH